MLVTGREASAVGSDPSDPGTETIYSHLGGVLAEHDGLLYWSSLNGEPPVAAVGAPEAPYHGSEGA